MASSEKIQVTGSVLCWFSEMPRGCQDLGTIHNRQMQKAENQRKRGEGLSEAAPPQARSLPLASKTEEMNLSRLLSYDKEKMVAPPFRPRPNLLNSFGPLAMHPRALQSTLLKPMSFCGFNSFSRPPQKQTNKQWCFKDIGVSNEHALLVHKASDCSLELGYFQLFLSAPLKLFHSALTQSLP